jgi:hypothetical protein
MAATKTAKTLLTSQSLAAGASVNATEWNLSTAYGGKLFVKLTNGSSAPTTAPTVKFYSGEATGIKRELLQAPMTGDTVNSSVTHLWFEYGPADMFANLTITNGATNSITVEAYGQELTGL